MRDSVPLREGVCVLLNDVEGLREGVILGPRDGVGVLGGVPDLLGVLERVGVGEAERVVLGLLVRVPEPVVV